MMWSITTSRDLILHAALRLADDDVYGFTLQVLALPFDLRDAPDEARAMADDTFGETYPGLRVMAQMAMTEPGVPIEFEFGLDLILDGLERRLAGT